MSADRRRARVLDTLGTLMKKNKLEYSSSWVRSTDIAYRIAIEDEDPDSIPSMKVTVSRELRKCINEGLVKQREDGGPYRLTPRGRTWIRTNRDLLDIKKSDWDEMGLSGAFLSFAIAPVGLPIYQERGGDSSREILKEKVQKLADELKKELPNTKTIILRLEEDEELE